MHFRNIRTLKFADAAHNNPPKNYKAIFFGNFPLFFCEILTEAVFLCQGFKRWVVQMITAF